MKPISCVTIAVLSFMLAIPPAFARGSRSAASSSPHVSSGTSHRVSGYTKQSGTYVAPARATNPNKTRLDNYSTKGNVNPYTGKKGTKRVDH